MLRKNVLLFFIFLSLALWQSKVSNMAQTQQTQQSNAEVLPFTSLTLEISVPSQTLLSLQPIPIIIKQENRTNSPALGYKAIGFNISPITIYVKKRGDERKASVDTTTTLGFTKYTNIEIPPGASFEGREWLALGLNKYFPNPGTYELQAILGNADGTQFIESNIVTIEIQAPSGMNRNAYNLIKNSSFQDYLFSGADFDKVKNTLETITTRYPNSAYSKSAFYSLGENYFHGRQYQQALTNLIRLENDDEFIFSKKIKKYLKEIRGEAQP